MITIFSTVLEGSKFAWGQNNKSFLWLVQSGSRSPIRRNRFPKKLPPSLRHWVLCQSDPSPAHVQLVCWQHLGQHVWSFLFGVDLCQNKVLFFYLFPKPVISPQDVIGPRMVGRILRKVDNTLTVVVESECILLNTQLSDEVLHPNYFLSSFYCLHVLRFCGWQCHKLMQPRLPWDGSPCRGHDVSKMDRLVSISANMSELVKPSNKGLPEPNWRHTLEVHHRYRSIHLTTAQCSLPEFLMNWFTTPTVYFMSGMVYTIAYIMLPTSHTLFYHLSLSYKNFSEASSINLFIWNLDIGWRSYEFFSPPKSPNPRLAFF